MYKVFFNDKLVFITGRRNFNNVSENAFHVDYHDNYDLSGFVDKLFEGSAHDKNYLVSDEIEKLQRKFVECFDKNISAAGGVVLNDKDEMLIIKRWGLWDLPKGKLEPGEDPEQCAIREVKEECGISDLKIVRQLPSTFHTYIRDNKKTLKQTWWFEMSYNGDEALVPQIEEDISEAKWTPEKDLGIVRNNTYLSIIDVLNEL